MNWISTNIRFPEDQYRKLKIKALNERKSLAKVVREAVTKNTYVEKESKKRKIKDVDKFMKDLRKLAKENSKDAPKEFSWVKALREMRYEQ